MNEIEARETFEDDMRRLSYDVIGASEHYNIWYIYQNDCDRPKYVNVMNNYHGFFKLSISAQFRAMVLILTGIFDKNTTNETISMYSLIKLAEGFKHINPCILQEIRRKLDSAEELVKKVKVLRDKVFAHSDRVDPLEAFKRAGISANKLKELVELSKESLEKISYAHDRGSFKFDRGAKEDTYLLLDNLLKLEPIPKSI